jgi:regulator of nucleoside diphosphate kinase
MPRLSHVNVCPNSDSVSEAPARDVPGLTIKALDLPAITVTAKDAMRLGRIIDDLHIRDRQAAVLASKLHRANIVDPADLREGIVTMRSMVEFWSGETSRLFRAMLVYPAEASVSENKISILTPIGTALLGLSEGQCMPYEASDGSVKRLSVNRVLFQPEAAWMGWL